MSKYHDKSYFDGLFSGIKSLATGMKVTMREFFTPKITEEYPENRATLKMFDRFRGSLVMPHDENNEHNCVGCGLCQMACPNDTIEVKTEMVEVDGKKKKVLTEYHYNLGSCMFCMLCVRACPHDAITFDQSYENAVFDRSKLVLQLNQPGSKLKEKPKPVRPAVAPAAAAPASAAAAPASAATAPASAAAAPEKPVAAVAPAETIAPEAAPEAPAAPQNSEN